MTSVKNENKDNNKEVDFVRKETRPGIYTTNALKKKIKIVDRGHYITKDPKEIKFFEKDPEIVVFNPGKKNKKKK